MIDRSDTQTLNILQENARTSNAEIARRVGLAPSAVHERIRKLEERGIIGGYSVRIEPRAASLGLLAFIFVRSSESPGEEEAARALAAMPEVQEVHHVAGEDCFMVKVRTRDTDALGELLRDKLKTIPAVRATRMTIVLDTIKESATLPLDGGGSASGT
jgi:Lrp/AsnC family transcriptional regulator, leucine-responsive regulatory protein